MNIKELEKKIYDILIFIVNYFKSIFYKELSKTDSHENDSDDTVTEDNEKQILLEELAEEVIERMIDRFHVFKKED